MPSTILDYIDRTVDLVGWHGMQPTGEVLLQQTLAPAGTGGFIVTGVQKVAQRFLIELLTETGSRQFWPLEGNDFLTEARLGAWQTPADALGAFVRAVAIIRPLLQAEEVDTDPADERFVDAVPLSVTLEPAMVIIRFRIDTQAGSDRNFIFPLALSL